MLITENELRIIIREILLERNQPNLLKKQLPYDLLIANLNSRIISEIYRDFQNKTLIDSFIDASTGNYVLQIDSPCIDAGTTELTNYHTITSNYYPGFSNIIEYQGTAPDMGAYEMIIAVNPPNNISYVQQTSSVMLMWNDIAASYSYMVEKSLIEKFTGY